MKSVLISIKPHWCELIAGGKKTIEVRKTAPKIRTPYKCYIYCTKGDILWVDKLGNVFNDKKYNRLIDDLPLLCNGKVIGEFVCDKIEPFDVPYPAFQNEMRKDILEKSCVEYYPLHRYAYHDCLFAWHISNLVVYNSPKYLDTFEKPCPYDEECWQCKYYDGGSREEPPCCNWEGFEITRPPQSWCYVEGSEHV